MGKRYFLMFPLNVAAAAAGVLTGQAYVLGAEDFAGVRVGFIRGQVGTLTPDVPLDTGATIAAIDVRASTAFFIFQLEGDFPDDDSQWISFTLNGDFAGNSTPQEYFRATADGYVDGLNITTWNWLQDPDDNMVAGNDYDLLIQEP